MTKRKILSKKQEKKVDKIDTMLYNIIIKVKEKRLIILYEGRGKSPIKIKYILKKLFSYPYLHTRLSTNRRNTMSSFIKAIKQSGTDSLDVIMKNGRVYRYVGIDADRLGYLLEAYQEKLDELLKALAIKFHVKVNREGIYKAFSIATTPCLVFTGGNVTIVSQSDYRGLGIIPIGKLLLPRAYVIKDEGYFYEVELAEKGSQKAENERETDKEYKSSQIKIKPLEDELEGEFEEEKTERQHGSVTKQMALQSLEMIKTIAENSQYNIDALAKIVEDYITEK